MGNTILTLLKTISALYFNSRASTRCAEIYDELQTIISTIKVDPRGGMGLGGEDSIIEALRLTAEWMIYEKNVVFSNVEVIHRITINVQGNSDYISIAKEYLDDNVLPEDCGSRVVRIMQELRYEKKRTKLKNVISKANAKLNYGGESVPISGFINELSSELETLHASTGADVNGLVGRINFSKEGDIAKVIEKTKTLVSTDGTLNTGFRGLNEECGGLGIPRGALVNIAALTHNYKSGMLIDLSLNIPRFNRPWMWDEKKKPLIFRISFENTNEEDMRVMYKKYYEITYGKECDLADIDPVTAEKELSEYFAATGYTFAIEHYEANSFSIYDLFAVLQRALDEGYEIHAVLCDYLTLIADHAPGEKLEAKIQNIYQMIRNFCNPKGIAFITAHQLSTAAANLLKTDLVSPSGFTRKVNSGGWYKDCGSLHQKLDMEFITHIVDTEDGSRYLSVARGKHRGGEKTPESHKHYFQKFEAIGGIVPDADEPEGRHIRSLPRALADDVGMDW